MKPAYIEFLKKQASQEDFNGEQARRQLDKLGIPYDEPLPPPTVFFDTNKDKSRERHPNQQSMAIVASLFEPKPIY